MIIPHNLYKEHFLTELKNNEYTLSGYDLYSQLKLIKNTVYLSSLPKGWTFSDSVLIVEKYVDIDCLNPTEKNEERLNFQLILNIKGLWYVHCGNVLNSEFLRRYNYWYSNTNNNSIRFSVNYK